MQTLKVKACVLWSGTLCLMCPSVQHVILSVGAAAAAADVLPMPAAVAVAAAAAAAACFPPCQLCPRWTLLRVRSTS